MRVFDSPLLLTPLAVALALLVVVAYLETRSRRKRREALLSEVLASRAGLAKAPRLLRPEVLLALLVALGTGLALARPRWGTATEKVERRGSDIVILLDTSASMRATDVSPSRFVLAREAASSLLTRLTGDRFALVACEGEAQVLVPLTLDTAAVGLFLDALEPGVGTLPGTSLAAGLATAVELLPPGAAGGKQCVVISDGEDLEGGVDEAIAKARAEGVTVHTVLVGSRAAPVPEVDVAGRPAGFKTAPGGSPVLSRPDPDLLRRLAGQTGGSFSVVSPGRTDLDGVASQIDGAARRPLSGTFATQHRERFQIPLGIAAAACALLLAGPLPRRRRLTAALLAAFLGSGAAAAQARPADPSPRPTNEAAKAATHPSLKQRILGNPPFTTARGEAVKGKKALEAGDAPAAVESFGRQAELDPQDPIGAYNLGTALAAAKQEEKALAALDQARRSPSLEVGADAAHNAGNLLFRGQKYDAAAQAFRESLKKRPGDADSAFNYELALRRIEEERKKPQQNQKPKEGKGQPTPTPTPGPQQANQKDQKQKDKEFEEKAKMSRERAEQLLAAIARADLDEQKKRVAEQKRQRRPGRDW